VLTAIVLGGVDFGRFAYNYVAVQNAARAGATNACMNNYTSSTQSTWSANAVQAAKNEMTSQTGYNSSNLTVSVNPVLDANGLRRVQVTASYPFTTIVNWPGLPNSVTLSQMAEQRLIR
jgi:Flp pilus assembly protein TadG